MAVTTRNGLGSVVRRGATIAPMPAMASAMKLVPPRNVPAAAPGNPARLAARPATIFSTSSPETKHRQEERGDAVAAGGGQQSVEECLGAGDNEHDAGGEQRDRDQRGPERLSRHDAFRRSRGRQGRGDALGVVGADRVGAEVTHAPRLLRIIDRPDHSPQPGIPQLGRVLDVVRSGKE